MKKLLKVLALVAVVACCAVAVAFAGCGESAKTYDGEYKYENAWTSEPTMRFIIREII